MLYICTHVIIIGDIQWLNNTVECWLSVTIELTVLLEYFGSHGMCSIRVVHQNFDINIKDFEQICDGRDTSVFKCSTVCLRFILALYLETCSCLLYSSCHHLDNHITLLSR